MRKVFAENLPRTITNKSNRINWKRSIGCSLQFQYDEISDSLLIVDYESTTHMLNIKYNDNYFNINTDSLLKCALGAIIGKHTKNFKVEIGANFINEKRNLVITDRQYREVIIKDGDIKIFKFYKYHCNICGWDEGWIVESSLLEKSVNCSCCTNKTVVEGINDITTVAPWMISYFQGGYHEAKQYTKASGKYIYPICPDCGKIKNKPIKICSIYKTKSIWCGCGDKKSYPEKFVYNMLEQLNINFLSEYTPIWCKYMVDNKLKQGRYDFYFNINNQKYILEIDGEQHKTEGGKNSKWMNLKKQQFIDECKDKLANENNCRIIRIDCEKSEINFIKSNIINSTLNTLFDFSSVNWNKCEEFALSNRVKEICLLWNSGINNSMEISKRTHLSRTTIINYLKKGNLMNWCYYNGKEEMIKLGKSYGKKIICTTNGMIFESSSECARLSESIFGIKLHTSGISSVCRHENSNTKGFSFEFYNNN